MTVMEWWERDAKADHINSATAVSSNLTKSPFIKLPKFPDKKYIKNKVILDIGCGYGRTLIPLAKLKPRIAYGLDISQEMLRHCAEYSKENNVKLKLINASLPKLPFENKSIDLIFSSSVLLHLPKSDIPMLLKEIKRVLKPLGKYILESSFPNSLSINGASNWFPSLWKSKLLNLNIEPGMPKHYSLKELKSIFEKAGLDYQIKPDGYQIIPTSINRFGFPFKKSLTKINKLFESIVKERKYRLVDIIFPRYFDVSGTKI